jgi:hypothetical protein
MRLWRRTVEEMRQRIAMLEDRLGRADRERDEEQVVPLPLRS